jgi:hypothetical protein
MKLRPVWAIGGRQGRPGKEGRHTSPKWVKPDGEVEIKAAFAAKA